MLVYKGNLFFENFEDAQSYKSYFYEMCERKMVLGDDIINDYGYSNLTYDIEKNKFQLYYNNHSFRDLHWGKSRKFYIPDWCNVYFDLKNQEYYNQPNFKEKGYLSIKKEVRFETDFSGEYNYLKQDKGIGRLTLGNVELNSTDKDRIYALEELLNKEYILDVNKIVFNILDENDYFERTTLYGVILRLLQRPNWNKFKCIINMSILDFKKFLLKSTAFNIVCTYSYWIKDLPTVEINLNTNLRGKKDLLSSPNRFYAPNIPYKPRKLTFNETFNIIKEILSSLNTWDISAWSEKERNILIKNKSNVYFKIKIK